MRRPPPPSDDRHVECAFAQRESPEEPCYEPGTMMGIGTGEAMIIAAILCVIGGSLSAGVLAVILLTRKPKK